MFIEQGEVSEVDFWESLQTLGLGRDLPLWRASRVVDTFKVSICTLNGVAPPTRGSYT